MKTNVCILFGGNSSEHEVSVVSAAGVLSNIDREKYSVIPVGITKTGVWHLCPENYSPSGVFEGSCDMPRVSVDLAKHSLIAVTGQRAELIPVDVVFPVLHGAYGEDGRIQGLLSAADIPFVGCDCESSAVCMDKAVTKAVLNAIGIRQADAAVVRAADIKNGTDSAVSMLEAKLGYPMFVKPARAGSSVGVTKAKNRESLVEALVKAAAEDTKILVEEFIKGREIEVAVLEESGKLTVSIPAEIDPGVEFYDYDAKYNTSTSSFYIPARITAEQTADVRALAAEIFTALDCRNLSRVDFFITDEGKFVFNEINTLPGFTPISMYPKLMQNEGMTYTELIDKLITAAIG